MKPPPDSQSVEAILREGNFLGTDPRPLREILADDEQALARRGATRAQVAARLQALLEAGMPGQGSAIAVPPCFRVRVEAERGRLSCPFGDAPMIRKTNVSAVNEATGATLLFTDLNLHLIATHGFFEGRGAPFRLEPDQVLDFLEAVR